MFDGNIEEKMAEVTQFGQKKMFKLVFIQLPFFAKILKIKTE
jgi:hypothetical protein